MSTEAKVRRFLVTALPPAVAVLIPVIVLAQSVADNESRHTEVRILTVQDNYKQPVVRATVETRRGARAAWIELGTTDVHGIVRISHTCQSRFRVRVIPESTSFYAENREGSDYECAETVTVTIRRLRIGASQEAIPLTELSAVDERQRRVPARIEEIDRWGNVTHIGNVTRTKVTLKKDTCTEGNQIRVTPVRPVEHIFLRPVQDCAANLTFIAMRFGIVPWLIEYAERAEERNDFGTAALLYNESMERASAIDPSYKRNLQIKTLTAAGAFFELPQDKTIATDPSTNNAIAMHETLRAAIAAYQSRMNLNEREGTLDYLTLKKMANADVYPFILRAYQEVDRANTGPGLGGPRP